MKNYEITKEEHDKITKKTIKVEYRAVRRIVSKKNSNLQHMKSHKITKLENYESVK